MSDAHAEATTHTETPGDATAGDIAAIDSVLDGAGLDAPVPSIEGSEAAGAATPAEPGAGDGDAPTGDEPAGVPETYDFAGLDLPEGMELDQGLAEEASPVLKELGLTQAQANKLAELITKREVERNAANAEASTAKLTSTEEAWAAQLKADAEVSGPGGQDYERNTKLAAQVVAKFGDPAYAKWLEDSRLGNHPSHVKAMLKVANALGLNEDSVGGGQPAHKEQPLHLRMYNEDGSPKT